MGVFTLRIGRECKMLSNIICIFEEVAFKNSAPVMGFGCLIFFFGTLIESLRYFTSSFVELFVEFLIKRSSAFREHRMNGGNCIETSQLRRKKKLRRVNSIEQGFKLD